MSWVFDKSTAKYSDRLILLAIANHCDRYGRNSWPKQTTIAAEARVSVREVIRAIEGLKASGELLVEEGAGEVGKHRYSLPLMIAADGDKMARDKSACDELARDNNVDSRDKSSSSTCQIPQRNKEEPSLNHPNHPTHSLGMRLPGDFVVTEEIRLWALSRGLPNPDEEYEGFVDYWTAATGANARKRDWNAAFRTWLRNAKKFNREKYGKSRSQQQLDTLKSDREKLHALLANS